MTETSILTVKELKCLKKDELVRLIQNLQTNEASSKKLRSPIDTPSKRESYFSASLAENSSPENQSLTISLVKSAVLEAFQDIKTELRSEYMELLKDLRNEFMSELDGFRKEISVHKIHFETSLREMESEFIRDIQEMEQRKNNLMIFGISESDEKSPDRRKQNDIKKIERLASELGVNNVKPENVVRLGRVGEKPRPIKLIKLHNQTRENLLKLASRIRSIDESLGFKNVFIKPDLTPKQQLCDRLLRAELRSRREKGENVMIQNGKIVNNDHSRPARNLE